MRAKEEWEKWYARPNPWDTEGTDKDRVRTELILARLERARFANLLDLGCGEGKLTGDLAVKAQRTYGFDIAEAALARARARYPHIEFGQGDLLEVVTRPELAKIPFDFIVLSEVLYYFQTDEERRQALAGVARLGTPACLYYFSVIVTGASKSRRYFTHDEFLDLVSEHFNVIDVFPSVADLPRPLELARNLLPSRRMRLSALRAWTATREPEQSRHLGCFAVKRLGGLAHA